MTETSMTAHEEHGRAQRKHAAWLEEIQQWKADHKRALSTLADVITFVEEHDALLDHHAEAIGEHEKRLQEHEAAIAASRGGEDEPEVAAEHRQLEELHHQVLEQHNRFKGRHPALIRQIAQLAVELHKVSHQPG